MKRKFSPGSEWLYLKIYTGVKTADIILEEAIQPVITHFQEKDYISKWFFIRYNDPKSHLRLRFRLTDTEYYIKILDKFNHILLPYIESREIAYLSIDTYNREIERYGQNTIEEAESLFCINSNFTLQCLDYDDEEKISISIFYIDKILDRLHLSVQEKLIWIKDFNTSFKQEFNADKNLNGQMNKKYRAFKANFENFLQSEEFLQERGSILSNIHKTDVILQQIICYYEKKSPEISLQDFFRSIFHMNINRLFISNQRLFEMVIYDYLLRQYKTIAYCSS